MNLRRWNVVPVTTAMFTALMAAGCSEARSLAPNPRQLDGMAWVPESESSGAHVLTAS
jgi:hypothetical protein